MILSLINKINDNKKIARLLVPILIGLALLLRLAFIPKFNEDLESYVTWYQYILAHGRFAAFGSNFSNYTPPYLYLLTLASYLDFLPALTLIKLISITSDFIASWLIYKIVALQFQDKKMPWVAFLATLFAPAVFFISAYWGQIDMLYTIFLLAFIYAMLKNKPLSAMVFFSISFAIKFQAIFIAPLILILILRKKIPWQYLLLPAPIYVLMMLPAWLASHKMADLLLIYDQQAGYFQSLSKNAPNPYIFISNAYYDLVVPIGLVIVVIAILAFVYFAFRYHSDDSSETLLTEAVLVLTLVPFLMPKMHERYFFPAMVFILVLAFYQPRFIRIALLFQITSMISYLPYLKGFPVLAIQIAAIGNFVIIAVLLYNYFKPIKKLQRRII